MELLTTLSLVLAAAVLLAVSFLFRRYQDQQFLSKFNIPHEKPSIFFGNFMQLKKDPIKKLDEWTHKFGRVFGYYVGERPHIVINDAEMIKQCFIKESHIFADRPKFLLITEPFASSLLGLVGDDWKMVRSALTTSFSASKMKLMGGLMNQSVATLLERINHYAETNSVLDMNQLSQGLTLDVIAKCALAMKVDCQRNPNDPLFVSVRDFFLKAQSPAIDYSIALPILRRIFERLYDLVEAGKLSKRIISNLSYVIENRRNGQIPRTSDMLQLMLDAQKESNCERDSKKGLLDKHITANSFLFLAAGFETTANALAFSSYLLVKHPEEQEKIYKEITELFPDKEELTYDDVQSLKYLDMVFSECLRLYPPVILFVSRTCKEDCTVLGQFFPKGSFIVAPVWQIHHDPDLWPDPFKFDPLRFSKENRQNHHPAAYLPFGIGPRICIGMRFALLEAKLAIARIIKNYRLIKCDQTEDPPVLTVPTVIINPLNGVIIKAVKRS